MNEEETTSQQHDGPFGPTGAADVTTGVPAVDAVLEQVHGTDSLPVDAHVAVFERAHEDLRRALDGAGND